MPIDVYGNEYERPDISKLTNFPEGGKLVKRGKHWYIAFREYFYKKEIGRESEHRTYWGKVVGDTCYSKAEYKRLFKKNGEPRVTPLDQVPQTNNTLSATSNAANEVHTTRRYLHLGFQLVAYGAIRESGIKEDLLKAGFDEHLIQVMFSLIMYNLCEQDNAFYLVKDWQQGRMLPFVGNMSSKDLSEFFSSIGQREDQINKFFKCRATRISDEEVLSIDSTNFECESENITNVAFGVGKHKERQNQIGVYFIVGHQSKMPVLYRVFAGNIHDSTTIEDFIKRAKELDLNKGHKIHVGDKGYYSEQNVIKATEENLKVIFSVKCFPKYINDLIDAHYSEIIDCKSSILGTHVRGTSYLHSLKNDQGEEVKVWVHLFFDIKVHADKIAKLEQQLGQFEQAWNKGDPKTLKEKYLLSFYKKPKGEPGKCLLERDWDYYNYETQRFGIYCNVSNFEQTAADNHSNYSSRDIIEKVFKGSKANDFDVARAHSDDTLQGRFFVLFLASICVAHIYKKMKEEKINELKNGKIKYSYPTIATLSYKQLVQKFKSINCMIYEDGSASLTEMPKNIRDILSRLGYEHAEEDALNDAKKYLVR